MKLLIDISDDMYANLPSIHVGSIASRVLLNTIKEGTPYKEKTGHWDYVTHYCRRYRVCSECHVEKEDDRATGWNYCQYCGARMEDKT